METYRFWCVNSFISYFILTIFILKTFCKIVPLRFGEKVIKSRFKEMDPSGTKQLLKVLDEFDA